MPASPGAQTATVPTTQSATDTISLAGSTTAKPTTTVSGVNPTPPPPPNPIRFEEVSSRLSDSKVPVEQRQQFAEQFVKDHVNANPDVMKGFRDVQAGNMNTPEAQKYQAQLKSAEDAFVKQHVEQAIKSNPAAAADPKTTGQIAGQAAQDAWQKFQAMPMPMQLMMGIGLPVGLVGLMSSLFGEGGFGAGLLGVLGLGAAGAGAAAGGLLGQDASNMAGDAMYNAGTFLGMVPEGKQDLSALKGEDAIARMTAGPSKEDQQAAFMDPAAHAQKVQQQLSQAEQVKKLMMIPEAARPQFLRRIDPSLSPEEAIIVARNAAQVAAQMDDASSPIATMMQQGRAFMANPHGVVNEKADEVVKSYLPRWAQGAAPYIRSGYQWASGARTKQSDSTTKIGANMNADIQKLIEKWAAKTPEAEAAAAAIKKASRCWAGYEPVPGAKAYSKGSCRPKGSKKTQKEVKEKRSANVFGADASDLAALKAPTSMPHPQAMKGVLPSLKQLKTMLPKPQAQPSVPVK